MNELISVIVPVYKVEAYLDKCVESIVNQTYESLEIILIDDGSPDNCSKICDEYAAKDKRFKVIHQKNGGVSVARQTGLDNSTGDYIIHCDPDDWIEPTMLDEMLDHAISNNADMIICDFITHKKNKIQHVSQEIKKPATAKEVQSKIINQQLHGSCCNKLIKRDCCIDIKFTPKDISLAEDELFIVRVLNKDIKVSYINKAYYHYRMDNTDSICSSKSDKIIISRTKVIEEYEKFLNREDYNNFFNIKYDILLTLFVTGNIKHIKHTYKDIHDIITKPRKRYTFTLPLGYFFSMSLKGNPYLAYYLYKGHLFIINAYKSIKIFFG